MMSVRVLVARSPYIPSDAVPEILSTRSGWSAWLSLAIITTAFLLVVLPGGMISGISGISKMPEEAGGFTVTVTVVSAVEGRSSSACSVLDPWFSEMGLSERTSSAWGATASTPGAGGRGSACPALTITPALVAIWMPAAPVSASAPQQAA